MDLKNKKILIVGGAGFIGHNLAIQLKKYNADVSIIDSLGINNLESLKNNADNLPFPVLSKNILDERLKLLSGVKTYFEDARDYEKMSKLYAEIKPEVIVHLAAVSHAGRSNKNPHTTFDHSLRTLENMLDASKKTIKHFIYLSSSMVYGNFKENEVNEDTSCEPLGIYGALKYAGEKIIIAYNQVFGIPYTIIRPSALYGERCISRRVGQIFIESALHKKEIYVDGDGEEKLDFTYIKDLLSGIIQVIVEPKSKNQIFNLTYGSARPILEMINILKNYFPNVIIKHKPRDSLTPIRGTLSIKKAQKLINYSPSWPLEKGYPEYIKWYKSIFS
jgi:nucleoside-diphosphate-sugar epimerase